MTKEVGLKKINNYRSKVYCLYWSTIILHIKSLANSMLMFFRCQSKMYYYNDLKNQSYHRQSLYNRDITYVINFMSCMFAEFAGHIQTWHL